MARCRRVAKFSSEVEPIHWRGNPALSQHEQIGAFDEPPLTKQFTSMYTQAQRRNGVSDTAGLGRSYMITPQFAIPPQRSQQLTNNPGAQRIGLAPNGGGPGPTGRLGVQQMMGAVTQAQVDQSGVGLMAWLQQLMGSNNAA